MRCLLVCELTYGFLGPSTHCHVTSSCWMVIGQVNLGCVWLSHWSCIVYPDEGMHAKWNHTLEKEDVWSCCMSGCKKSESCLVICMSGYTLYDPWGKVWKLFGYQHERIHLVWIWFGLTTIYCRQSRGWNRGNRDPNRLLLERIRLSAWRDGGS